MVCCVLHNFCQLMDMPKPMVQDVQQKKGSFGGISWPTLFFFYKGDVTKEVGEMICNVLFASWLEHKIMFVMGMFHYLLASKDILALH